MSKDEPIPTTESNQLAEQKKRELTPAQRFRSDVTKMAGQLLSQWVGEERAGEAVGRLSVALAASATASRKPEEFFSCTRDSIARVIATSALTGIMPSTGAGALAYAIPRRARKGEDPQLQYQLSHRGVNALANRAGLHMFAMPIGIDDSISIGPSGMVQIDSIDLDNPPTSIDQLRGVIVQVIRLETSALICTGWVAKKLILERREMSDAYQFAVKNDYAKESDPWHRWPIEQAMKCAMHYAINRGWCVIDDTEAVRALAADGQSDVIDSVVVPTKRLGGLIEPTKNDTE